MANQSGCWNRAMAGMAFQRNAQGAPFPLRQSTVPVASACSAPLGHRPACDKPLSVAAGQVRSLVNRSAEDRLL